VPSHPTCRVSCACSPRPSFSRRLPQKESGPQPGDNILLCLE
jgi:hypothetical protein